MRKRLFWIGLCTAVAAIIILIGWWSLRRHEPFPLASVPLADGRIIRIEAVAFGTNLMIGNRSIIIDNLGKWLSPNRRRYFEPKFPQSRITPDRPSLVVWLDAIDSLTSTNVDCQGIRVALIDDAGDHFVSDPNWSGFGRFWRSGHLFGVFPRDARKLTLEITPRRTNVPVRLELLNPAFTEPRSWTGLPLPQTNIVGDMEVALTALEMATNGSPDQNWTAPLAYWNPVWDVRCKGSSAAGWNEPEWEAEDAVGNRGRYLGTNRPVLRFYGTVYPAATNTEAAVLLATLPQMDPATVTNNVVWNTKISLQSMKVDVLGCFPPGVHIFYEGGYVGNPPPLVRMRPPRGGAPSGWVGMVIRLSSFQTKEWNGHYTTNGLVIYLRLPADKTDDRLAIRLRDKEGRYWLAQPESEGASHGIMPYLVQLPPGVGTVTPEVVLLKPLHAEFMVDTRRAAANP